MQGSSGEFVSLLVMHDPLCVCFFPGKAAEHRKPRQIEGDFDEFDDFDIPGIYY